MIRSGSVVTLLLLSLLLTSFIGGSQFLGKVNTANASTGLPSQGAWQLREFEYLSYRTPDVSFEVNNDAKLVVNSTYPSDGARGYVFLVVNRSALDGKKLQIRWNLYYTYQDSRDLAILNLFVFDKAFNRTDETTYFQEGLNYEPIMNYTHINCCHYPAPLSGAPGWYGWRNDTSSILNLTNWSSDLVTVLISTNDNWMGQQVQGYFDWLKVLDSNNNVVSKFGFTGFVQMEVTGTFHDYGIFYPAQMWTTMAVNPQLIDAKAQSTSFCFSVNVSISNVTSLYGYEMKLVWDPTIVQPSSVNFLVPSTWGKNYFIGKNETTNGQYWLALSALPPATAFTGNTTIASLKFNVTSSALITFSGKTVETPLGLTEAILSDNLGNAIPHISIGATARIKMVLMGDVNGDGVVNVLDLVRVATKFGQHGSPGWIPEDVNSDGSVNLLDLILVASNLGRHI